METNEHTAAEPTLLSSPRAQDAFGAAKNSVMVYGALSVVALVAVIVVASSGHMVNTFMWVRAILLPLIAGLIFRMTNSASQGSRRDFERVSGLSVIMPIAIIVVDLIPGICPLWYAVTQIVCMLPLIRTAFITRGPALREAFPKSR